MSPNASAVPASSEPIVIESNADLVAQASSNAWPGNGTVSNPYIIANMSFTGFSDMAMWIDRVDLHLVIQDCSFTDCDISVEIDMSRNVTFARNTIYGGYEGMVIFGAAGGIIVSNNTIDEAHYGMYLCETDNIVVCNNTISNAEDYNILLEGSDGNTIIGNDIINSDWCGICLAYSNDNIISDNTVTDASVGIFLAYLSYRNTITGNTVLDCDPDEGGVVIVDTVDDNTVSDNTVTFADGESKDDSDLIIMVAAVLIIAMFAMVLVASRKKD
ncbi:MAG: right-handed parallel beta-helix repeat-containing protein [Euryarchaeota archaeon]|nr:right-handed parallel beta-helix repeat-containing protein [Euryarchaeota archaeon]